MPNRLIDESSPYLLQHADNPVEWYPWGQEAFGRATAEDKPIFLSIGYSACHWCHVMARESFEDPETAGFLNARFVNVKVDREERPDLDQVYMSAVQALTGGGGWPMSVFLTPQGTPFYGGTYFPPEPRHGMPSFRQILQVVADAWKDRREEMVSGGSRLVETIARQGQTDGAGQGEPLRRQVLQGAFHQVAQQFDRAHGGWGGAPKFPQPMTLEFLLRYHHVTGDGLALQMVSQTLEAMARGGIYDQLGGGFHRYSVDERWLVPHFEKMLYDNAQLARVYLHAWQVTRSTFFRTITEEILDYVAREMTGPAGGFYSTQDADSAGQEGAFFLWRTDEIVQVLGKEAGRFLAAYRVTERGNASVGAAPGHQGMNVLEYAGRLDERSSFAGARRTLFRAREQRVHPGRDDKVLASWNGLMLAAFAEAARVLGREDYRPVAEHNGGFLLSEMRQADGRLRRSWRGGQAWLNGYLEDYSFVVDGLLELYQTTFDPRWYESAKRLAEVMMARFHHPGGGFYDTSDDHEALIARPRNLQDNATPSGSAMAIYGLLRLADLAAEPRYRRVAEEALAAMQPMMARHPLGFAQWLVALDYALGPSRELGIVGLPGAADTRALWEVVRASYSPHQVVAMGLGDDEMPLLQDRTQLDGRATAYLCVDSACLRPVTEPAELQALLAGLADPSQAVESR